MWLALDADGVLIRSQVRRRFLFSDSTSSCSAEALSREFEEIERFHLTRPGFKRSVSDWISKRSINISYQQLMERRSRILVNQAVVDVVRHRKEMFDGVALATNQVAERLEQVLQALSCTGIIDKFIASSLIGYAKPQREYFIELALRTNGDPEQILFIDDREENVEGARDAGLQGVAYNHHLGASLLDEILRINSVTASH